MNFNNETLNALAELSLADAKHDFDKTTRFASLIKNSLKFFNMGIPNSSNKLLKEDETFDLILKNNKNYTPTQNNVKHQIETITNQTFFVTPISILNNDWDKIKAKLKKQKSGAEYEKLKEENKYLGADSIDLPDHSVLLIDAPGVSLKTILTSGKKQNKTLYYVLTPEVINDPAPKSLPNEILKLNTNNGYNYIPIVPSNKNSHTYLWNNRDKSPQSWFFSNYGWELSPLIEKNGKYNVNVKVFNNYKKNNQNKINIENENDSKNNNAINNLVSAIKKFLQKPKNNQKEIDNFNIKLQQKRGGDWLQALACLQLHERNFKEYKTNKTVDFEKIYFVTHDRIALAFALLMGINTLYGNASSGQVIIYDNESLEDREERIKKQEEKGRKEEELFNKNKEKKLKIISEFITNRKVVIDHYNNTFYRPFIKKQYDELITFLKNLITQLESNKEGISIQQFQYNIQNLFSQLIVYHELSEYYKDLNKLYISLKDSIKNVKNKIEFNELEQIYNKLEFEIQKLYQNKGTSQTRQASDEPFELKIKDPSSLIKSVTKQPIYLAANNWEWNTKGGYSSRLFSFKKKEKNELMKFLLDSNQFLYSFEQLDDVMCSLFVSYFSYIKQYASNPLKTIQLVNESKRTYKSNFLISINNLALEVLGQIPCDFPYNFTSEDLNKDSENNKLSDVNLIKENIENTIQQANMEQVSSSLIELPEPQIKKFNNSEDFVVQEAQDFYIADEIKEGHEEESEEVKSQAADEQLGEGNKADQSKNIAVTNQNYNLYGKNINEHSELNINTVADKWLGVNVLADKSDGDLIEIISNDSRIEEVADKQIQDPSLTKSEKTKKWLGSFLKLDFSLVKGKNIFKTKRKREDEIDNRESKRPQIGGANINILDNPHFIHPLLPLYLLISQLYQYTSGDVEELDLVEKLYIFINRSSSSLMDLVLSNNAEQQIKALFIGYGLRDFLIRYTSKAESYDICKKLSGLIDYEYKQFYLLSSALLSSCTGNPPMNEKNKQDAVYFLNESNFVSYLEKINLPEIFDSTPNLNKTQIQNNLLKLLIRVGDSIIETRLNEVTGTQKKIRNQLGIELKSQSTPPNTSNSLSPFDPSRQRKFTPIDDSSSEGTVSVSSSVGSTVGGRKIKKIVEVSVKDGKYKFNGNYDESSAFSMEKGSYTFKNIPEEHPIGFIINEASKIEIKGKKFEKPKEMEGVKVQFYTGTIVVKVKKDFGTISYSCFYHGYMGGENNLVFVKNHKRKTRKNKLKKSRKLKLSKNKQKKTHTKKNKKTRKNKELSY